MARNLSYGSSGDDVKKLQELLNGNGANLDVDGVFGSKTESAVKAYQKANGLAVDGIAGVNTMGSLTKANTENKQSPGTSTPITTNTDAGASGSNTTGTTGDIVTQAQELLNNQLQGGNAQLKWSDQVNDIINQIMNREPFSYDMNADKLYDQYKGQYQAQGKMAMEDAIGKAATLTGGYGNSYAQQVGQQTYQGYLDQLNDRIPELYSLALSKYQMEGDALTDKLALLTKQEQEQYDRALTMYQLLGYATPEVAEILGIPESSGSSSSGGSSYGSGSSGSGSSGSGSSGSLVNGGLDDSGTYVPSKTNLSISQIKTLQQYMGLDADGTWDYEDRYAAGGRSADEVWKLIGRDANIYEMQEYMNPVGFKEGDFEKAEIRNLYTPKNSSIKLSSGATSLLKVAKQEGWNQSKLEKNILAEVNNGYMTTDEASDIFLYLGLI